MDEVVENLRACLLSSKGGISVNRINKDYYDVVGEWIPYRRLNFNNLEELLSVVPGIKKVQRGNEYFIQAIPSEKTSHVASLVNGQKADKKARKVTLRKKPVRTPSGSNQNYQRAGFRPQATNTRTTPPSFTNTRIGNFRDSPKTMTNKSPSPTSNSRFKYPPSSDYVPLMDIPTKPPMVNVRPAKSYNECSRVSPTKRMMEKDPRRENDLKKEIDNSRRETDNSRREMNNSRKEVGNSKRDVDISKKVVNYSKRVEDSKREVPKKASPPLAPKSNLQSRLIVQSTITKTADSNTMNLDNSDSVASMIPFEDFGKIVKKNPQDELQSLAMRLKLSPPIYTIQPLKNGNIYAAVIIGDKKISSYPEDARTEFVAQSIAAEKALEYLQEKFVLAPLPITKDENLIKKRILKIIDSHPGGVFTSQIIKYYKEDFKELLPEKWMNIVANSEISVELGADGTTILTRDIPSKEKVEIEPPISPFSKMQLTPLVRPIPKVLQVPVDPYWITHVTAVYSTDEILVQLVGEEYSDKFETMTKQMNEFYLKNFEKTKASNIEIDAFYTVCVDQNWYRVKCLEYNSKTGQATVYFIDYGDDEVCPKTMLHDLDKEFCNLGAQAIRLSLHNLEEFSDCQGAETIIKKYLLERSLYIQVQKYDSEEGVTSAIFYDTDGPNDIDLNKQISLEIIKTCMVIPQLKTENRVTEVYISHVSETGNIYLQFKCDNLMYLANLMNKLNDQTLSKDVSKLAVSRVNLTKVYVAKSPEDGNWYRANVKNVNYTENEVDAFFIDFGKTVTVKISNLVDLESVSEMLAIFPPQALQVQFYNIPCSFFDTEKIARLTKLAPPNQSLLLKVVQKSENGSPPVVELFRRQESSNEIISINNTLVFDSELTKTTNGNENKNLRTKKRSERLTSRYGSSGDQDDSCIKKSLRPPKIPAINEFFDVHVTLVSNPGNFIVQPYADQQNLSVMHEKMQEECKRYNGAQLTLETVKEGTLYAAQHFDGEWYRVCILNKFMNQSVTVYFCDYGDVTVVQPNKLQPLSSQFFELPYQAIRAKLADVKPVNVDWAVDDCMRLKELIEGKELVSVVREFVLDQSGETVLSLGLIDVSKPDDVHIDEILISEERAQRPESYVKPKM